jgi:hypothetical protein
MARPPRKLPVLLWIGAVAAVIVGIGAGAIGVKTARQILGPVVAAAATPLAQPSSVTKVVLTAPKSIGGRSRNTDPDAQSRDGKLTQALLSAPGSKPDDAVAASYGNGYQRNAMMIFATRISADVASELDGADFDAIFTRIADASGGGVPGYLQAVDPGALGGGAKCAALDLRGVPSAMCAWHDNASLGVVVWSFMTLEKAKAEFVTVRELIEHPA